MVLKQTDRPAAGLNGYSALEPDQLRSHSPAGDNAVNLPVSEGLQRIPVGAVDRNPASRKVIMGSPVILSEERKHAGFFSLQRERIGHGDRRFFLLCQNHRLITEIGPGKCDSFRFLPPSSKLHKASGQTRVFIALKKNPSHHKVNFPCEQGLHRLFL